MPPRSVCARLRDIIDNIDCAKSFLGGRTHSEVLADRLTMMAIERAIEIISEASRHVPEASRSKHPDIPWRNVMDVGNWLRHAYQRVDGELILGIVLNDLDSLKQACEQLLAEETASRAGEEKDG